MKPPFPSLLRPFVILALAACAGLAHADPEPTPFETWLDGFRQSAARQGISQATLDATLTGLKPIDKLIEYDRKQPEFQETFLDYLNKRVSESRLRAGQAMQTQHAELLTEVERRYGVPARYLLAFWGLETSYGNHLGQHPTIAALATLAFDARRADFFRQQLMDALRIIDRGDIAAADLKGSWAGAFGHMQFIPSTHLAHGVDGDGDGHVNPRASLADALHSAANYLRRAGWRPDEEWGLEVRLPEGFNLGEAGLENQRPLNVWGFMGITLPDGNRLPVGYQFASLLLPQGAAGPAVLVYPNFRVIMNWNRSINYALAVGHLADRLAGATPLVGGLNVDNRRLSREQMEILQKSLAALGYDPGPADGIAGTRTSAAIRAYQSHRGLPADGYPSVPLLEHLRNTLLEQALPLPEGKLPPPPENKT